MKKVAKHRIPTNAVIYEAKMPWVETSDKIHGFSVYTANVWNGCDLFRVDMVNVSAFGYSVEELEIIAEPLYRNHIKNKTPNR